MPENKKHAEPLDEETLKHVVGGATDEEIESGCPPPPPPPATNTGN